MNNSKIPLASPTFASRSKADYYSFDINTTKTTLTTDGKNPVEYVFTIVNTGNKLDTYTIFAVMLEVTSCSEPDAKEWSYSVDTSLISLAPSQSAAIVLTVSTSCGCQVGCKATIEITCTSGGNPSVKKSILTYTTRGPAKKVSGLVVEIDYNAALNPIYLDTVMKFDVYIYNLQNQQDSVVVWPTAGPETWSIGVSPDEFTLGPNSKRLVTLNLKVPTDQASGDYKITLTAQSIDSPSVQGKDSILIQILPDVIISDVSFSTNPVVADKQVELKITVKNIGRAAADEIPIIVYDKLNLTTDHELTRQVISQIGVNESKTITITWRPANGSYNITIVLDPEATLEELTKVNNFRIEPVVVKSSSDQDSESILIYVIIIVVLVLVVLFILYRAMKKTGGGGGKQSVTEKPGKRTKPGNLTRP
ncbi:CARDB domain-containing protein [[Eubacterium] cellulosolvens]